MDNTRIREIIERHVTEMIDEITNELELAMAPYNDAIQALQKASTAPVAARPYTCSCGQVMNSAQELLEHRRAEHPSNRPTTCIAPGCDKPNKGPRGKYLCEEHLKTATQAELDAWRAARKAKPE